MSAAGRRDGGKALIFTDHAELMLVERAIEREWVEATIADPEQVEPDPKAPRLRAFRTIRECEGRVLRVVFEEAADEITIVTAFFDRARRRKPASQKG